MVVQETSPERDQLCTEHRIERLLNERRAELWDVRCPNMVMFLQVGLFINNL